MWSSPCDQGSLSHRQKNQPEDAEDPAMTACGHGSKPQDIWMILEIISPEESPDEIVNGHSREQ